MLSILHEDNYLLAINKPAGLQAENDRWGNPSLEGQVSAYLKKTYPWKKQLITGVVHRLDRQVSGVMLFALTPMALKDLGSQFEKRTVRKIYLAVVENSLPDSGGELGHWLKKDLERRKAVIASGKDNQARQCRLRYKVLQQKAGNSLVEVELLTGRYHQIRAQLAAEGCPILGDQKYGSSMPVGEQTICLHARCLDVLHPKTATLLQLKAPLPDSAHWKQWDVAD
jgi:23S rRNA pseudouridine1911/1915/1917 synthase